MKGSRSFGNSSKSCLRGRPRAIGNRPIAVRSHGVDLPARILHTVNRPKVVQASRPLLPPAIPGAPTVPMNLPIVEVCLGGELLKLMKKAAGSGVSKLEPADGG